MSKRKTKVDKAHHKKQKVQDVALSAGVFSKTENDWENLEQDYELLPRTVAEKETIEALPIKRGGKIERVIRNSSTIAETPVVDEAEEFAASDVDEGEPDEKEKDKVELNPAERLLNIKEEIASHASKLLEDPDENIECLGKLRKLAESTNFATSQLAILALIPVFKALAPGYKIRPLTEAENKERVGKDVARVRKFEQSLVVNYHSFIELLSKLARVLSLNSENNKNISSQQIRKGQIATSAACELCSSSLRNFNYRAELFTIPIRRLNRRPRDAADLKVFTRCLRTLETLLKEDKEHGAISFEIISIMCKILKEKSYRVDEAVINVFLSLSLLDDYDPHGNRKDAPTKTKKKDRVHLSKKQRKARKELKEIEDEIRKAEQSITAEERERHQAQSLKMVLTSYLEILKIGSTDPQANSPAKLLVAAVMEGLSKFGRMANVDLLGDFLEVLREIMSDIMAEHTLQTEKYGVLLEDSGFGGLYSSEEIRKLLLCVSAAFALFLNHQEVGRLPMAVDLSSFISNLYTILVDISVDANMEFSHKSLRLQDPLSDTTAPHKPAVNVSTNAELLLKSLDFIFFRSKNGSLVRSLPFTKRLYVAALQTPEKSTIATLKFVGKLVGRYGVGLKGLWSTEERITGQGNYVLGLEKDNFEVDMERANVGSAVLWENVLLDKHYCNIVKDGSRTLMKNSRDRTK